MPCRPPLSLFRGTELHQFERVKVFFSLSGRVILTSMCLFLETPPIFSGDCTLSSETYRPCNDGFSNINSNPVTKVIFGIRIPQTLSQFY